MTWGAVAGAVIGGVVSYASASEQADATREAADKQGKADPRFNALLWGNGKDDRGMLGNAQAWYNANQSGLNPQMLQGLNAQWQTLSDPNLRNGYNNMSNMGNRLMNAPVAGNPFTDGRNSLDRPFNAMQYTDALNRGDNRTFGTQMAPGLLNSSQGYGSAQGMSQYGPQGGGQGGQNSYQPLPVNFGGSQGGQGNGGGGLLTDGPFTAPAPVVKPPEEVKPVAPTAAQTNRPFDLQQFTDNFYTDFANGTATPEQIAEFNNITSRNYG